MRYAYSAPKGAVFGYLFTQSLIPNNFLMKGYSMLKRRLRSTTQNCLSKPHVNFFFNDTRLKKTRLVIELNKPLLL